MQVNKDILSLVQAMYAVAVAIETDDPDEKWRTANKLKNAANDAYFYVNQVSGAGAGQSTAYDCINARKHLATLKAMYLFAAKQGMAELEPASVVMIDKLTRAIDAEQAASEARIKANVTEDLEPWMEKYRIWQKISKQ